METARILIALKNPDEARVMARTLGEAGYDTVTADDGAAAIEAAVNAPPTLVIADPELPLVSGERLFQILRNNPRTASAPFLFISDGIIDIKGFRAGTDVFLVRPVNMGELGQRVGKLLTRVESFPAETKELEGQLKQMTAADVLQFLHINKKEGELRISTETSAGTVYVKDGQVYNAVTEGVEREKALFRILQWTEGVFEFIPRQVEITKKIRASTGNLLMEGMRQMDEFRKHMESFPDGKAVLKMKYDPATLPKGLPQIVYEIAGLVGSSPTVRDLVDRSSYTDYETLRAISSMLARGILVQATPSGAPGREDSFLTKDQALSVREKILSRFADSLSVNHARIFVFSTSHAPVKEFIGGCASIRGFTVDRHAFEEKAVSGEVASFPLYGGMDVLFFAFPTVKDMGPLIKALSTNLVGLIVLWDDNGAKSLKDVVEARTDVLASTRVPVAHVYSGGPQGDNAAYYRKALGLKPDEPVFRLSGRPMEAAREVLYSIFGKLLKEDYVTI